MENDPSQRPRKGMRVAGGGFSVVTLVFLFNEAGLASWLLAKSIEGVGGVWDARVGLLIAFIFITHLGFAIVTELRR